MPTESLNRHLDVASEVAEALAAGHPVVALESTIISHGMPYPRNVETAFAVEDAVRKAGAVPATIAILDGRLRVGLVARVRFACSAGRLSRPLAFDSSPPAIQHATRRAEPPYSGLGL